MDPRGNTFFRTTGSDLTPTVTHDDGLSEHKCLALLEQYESIQQTKRLSWTTHLHLLRILGSGGQGIVYLTERRGADDFTLPVALKIFSPERYSSPAHYDSDMARLGRVAAKIARIQHENLLVVENFLDRDRIRMMVMEWVEGFDLRRLLTPKMLGLAEQRVSQKRWEHINDVLVTKGPVQPRLKAGVAVSIVRECLAGLAALHRNDIVHGDIKPANIMLKRSGHAKIIDVGSSFDLEDPPAMRGCTPAYAAPEVLEGLDNTPRSDLASLGYVTIELLAGCPLFSNVTALPELLEAKRTLADRLPEVVPAEVSENDLLMKFCRRLVAPDPADRFPTAEDAEFVEIGAAAFHRQLIKNDMATEYENDIRIWIDELLEIELEEMGTQP